MISSHLGLTFDNHITTLYTPNVSVTQRQKYGIDVAEIEKRMPSVARFYNLYIRGIANNC